MALIYHSLSQGSLLDRTGNYTNTLTAGVSKGFIKYGLGVGALDFDGADTKIDTGSEWIGTQAITISVWIYADSAGEGSVGRIIDNEKFVIRLTSLGNFNVYSDGSTAAGFTPSISWGRWYHIIISRTTNGTANMYVNGTQTSQVNQSSGTPVVGTTNVIIGNSNGQTATFDGLIQEVKVWNTVLTRTEIDAEYAKFVTAKKVGNIARTVKEFVYPKPAVVRDYGIVSAYNMIKNGNVLPDVSNNAKDGTITGTITSPNGLKFTAANSDKVALGNIGNVKSMSFRIKLASTTEKILEGSANSKLISVSTGTLTYTTFNNAFINGNDTDTITAGVWNNVTITSTSNVSMSAATLALNNVTYGSFEIEDLRFYSTELSASEIADYNNNYEKRIILKEDFSDEGADGITKVPTNWQRISGTWKIDEATANSGTIKKGTKYLQSVTAGALAIPSEQAYGTWEFDFYKGADANALMVFFISDRKGILNTSQGYGFIAATNENFFLIKNNIDTNDNLIVTATSYFLINTWYRIKITRSTLGVFTVYIKGGTFGTSSWTTISVVGGSGTNPVTNTTYTTSSYFVLDLDGGDRIANIKIYQGIV